MAKVIYKPNLLESRELSCHMVATNIQVAINKMAELYPEFSEILERGGNYCFIVSVNGLEIPQEMWIQYPISENDEIVISHDIGWTAVILPFLASVWSAVTSTAFLVSLAINVVVYAINYFTRPDPPRVGGMGRGDFTSSSPTYGWSGIVTTHDVDRPIPVEYGKHARGGNLIFEGGR